MHLNLLRIVALVIGLAAVESAAAQQIRIPHHQDKPPGPALSPAEAVRKMTVPPGFRVEVVAAEPDIVNPVAMTIDEKGRFWICESLEYPRRAPGRGRDRVKVLEDTDGDGRADKFTVFADDLNIPSGVAVGYGGVWVANSPDILFLRDTDGDGRADEREVVVTGFGRRDTHELPNSLTWGPDGWLYGLNGVFNHSHVRYPESNPNYDPRHPGWRFTCAMFRIHPRTREFQVFAEGTSNPWGIAFDGEGSAFISACVIDHLWHIVETGYYHRQGGPYPPHTWKIESIVGHKHQKAAYCGLHYFDSDAYPVKYREKLYMGNIHGGCVNVDKLRRDGSTYFATPEPDFLTANDAWFMPVVQKTGPDGCLYILDWYDRYHCYQDANRDPKGIDRLRGRLYRVRYKDTPRVKQFDLAKNSDRELIERLGAPNDYIRRTAQRLLSERSNRQTQSMLERLVFDGTIPRKQRMHALWALAGMKTLDEQLLLRLTAHDDPVFRAWAVRLAGNRGEVGRELLTRINLAVRDESADVSLQAAVAAGKIKDFPTLDALLTVLERSGDDELLPRIVWQNLHPLLKDEPYISRFVAELKDRDFSGTTAWKEILPRGVGRLLPLPGRGVAAAGRIAALVIERRRQIPEAARRTLGALSTRVQSGELTGQRLAELKTVVGPALTELFDEGTSSPLFHDAAFLATSWNDPRGIEAVRTVLASPEFSAGRRLDALGALISAGDAKLLDAVATILARRRENEPGFRGRLLLGLGRLQSGRVADVVLEHYRRLEPELQPRAVELLTQRPAWAKKLLAAIGEKRVPAEALNVNQVRRLLATNDKELAGLIRKRWGTIRERRDPKREKFVAEMKQLIRTRDGDAFAGEKVFKKVCAQCHRIYGEGEDVGPDITLNGRNSFEQLLSNVFDPSLVIGAAYRATIIVTEDGRLLTGLVVEESPQRVVLKVQGGKLETIPRGDIEIIKPSDVSMMPEGLENQLAEQEIADLFAFLTLDRPPGDPHARRLPGVKEVTPRSTTDPQQFAGILAEVAPGFSTKAVGEGLALLAGHMGRAAVVRTHPPARGRPCVLTGRFELPAGKKSKLLLSVSHHPQGDWRLLVRVDDRTVLDRLVGAETTTRGWAEHEVDLSGFAGRTVKIELLNAPSDWHNEYAYWGRAAVVTER